MWEFFQILNSTKNCPQKLEGQYTECACFNINKEMHLAKN